ncbi:MAG TPA: NAD-dependent epimerase/dehydratase family protein [Alphaproteobacteria bacterium]|jgi:dTDP-L-rhamnose 4-epimerase|nr:NAD-dependent epimerase/dehydratase family protein [Alphaproteobacteria bacterium]
MPKLVLVTGGAGFIGSHVTDLLLASGYRVRVLDNLSPQVHGDRSTPEYLNRDAEFMFGDVRDAEAVARALDGVDAVVHLAAAVGVGQSMYEIVSYTETNELGTAVLLQALARRPVERLIVASSMSIYGEGLAKRQNGEIVVPEGRPVEQLKRGIWELQDSGNASLIPLATPETKPPALSSIYALQKYNQERMCLIVGKAYGMATVALRFFNVFGPRQALSNPYTGVLAIFAARLLNGRAPLVFEDGRQRRDFVHVTDIARACLLALETERGVGNVYNVGSGQSRSILSVGEDLADVMNLKRIAPEVTGKYRAGDIRHCFADISKSRAELGFAPEVDFREGLVELADWLSGQVAVDTVDRATQELASRGLVG